VINRPKSSSEKIEELLQSLNSTWLIQIQKEIDQYPSAGSEGEMFSLPVFYRSETGQIEQKFEEYKFEWFCWSGGSKTTMKRTKFGFEIFREIIALIEEKHKNWLTAEGRAEVVQDVIYTCKEILSENLTKITNPLHANALKYVIQRGIIYIQGEFIDLLDPRENMANSENIIFDLKQDHLAYLLVALKNAGIIENPHDEIVRFANRFFRIKEGSSNKKLTVSLTSFNTKYNNFLNGNRPSKAAKNEVLKRLMYGMDKMKS
jgi:hypothetical protein